MRVFEVESTVKQWDADYYQPTALWLYDRAIADMLGEMDIEEGATVLDAGCGPGVHSIRVAKAGYRVCAIDISRTMLEHARQRIQAEHLADRVEFRQKDLTCLDFDDASFKYVFSWGVMLHIPEAERAFGELARIVAPGGKLALYLTNKSAVDFKIEGLLRFLLRRPLMGLVHRPLGDGTWCDLNGERLWVWRFDVRAVSAHLASKGFRLIHHRIGELSETQRRVGWPFRNALLHLNNLAYRMRLPPSLAVGHLLIFEKTG